MNKTIRILCALLMAPATVTCATTAPMNALVYMYLKKTAPDVVAQELKQESISCEVEPGLVVHIKKESNDEVALRAEFTYSPEQLQSYE